MYLSRRAYRDIEKMLGPLREQVFVGGAQSKGFHNITRTLVSLEHRMVDHISQI